MLDGDKSDDLASSHAMYTNDHSSKWMTAGWDGRRSDLILIAPAIGVGPAGKPSRRSAIAANHANQQSSSGKACIEAHQWLFPARWENAAAPLPLPDDAKTPHHRVFEPATPPSNSAKLSDIRGQHLSGISSAAR